MRNFQKSAFYHEFLLILYVCKPTPAKSSECEYAPPILNTALSGIGIQEIIRVSFLIRFSSRREGLLNAHIGRLSFRLLQFHEIRCGRNSKGCLASTRFKDFDNVLKICLFNTVSSVCMCRGGRCWTSATFVVNVSETPVH